MDDPRDDLSRIVHTLLCDKAKRDFPIQCAEVFDSTIRPLIDENGHKDGMVLPASTSVGKRLRQVMMLAIAVQRHGMETLGGTGGNGSVKDLPAQGAN